MFNDRWMSPTEIVSNTIYLAKEWEINQIKRTTLSKTASAPPPPPPNCTIVRSDAAWSGKLMIAGLRWTISDQYRTQTFMSSEFFVASPLVAEGLALREAIVKCKDIGITRVICGSDCSQLVKALKSEIEIVELYGIISDLLSIASKFEEFSIHWIPRGKNVYADSLAKQVLAMRLHLL